MKESVVLLFILVTAVSSQDAIHLEATKESQYLTSPSLEGISRPHDFKWRIWFNTSETYSTLVVTLHHLDVPERSNCSGSYIELINEEKLFGQRCAQLKDESFQVFGSYLDVIFHIGTENGTREFKMSYFLNPKEVFPCIIGFEVFPFWAFILLIVVVLCSIIIVCCCVYRRCRKQNQPVAKKARNRSKFEKSLVFVNTGPPSYDDVIKGDCKPPPYSTVVKYAYLFETMEMTTF